MTELFAKAAGGHTAVSEAVRLVQRVRISEPPHFKIRQVGKSTDTPENFFQSVLDHETQ